MTRIVISIVMVAANVFVACVPANRFRWFNALTAVVVAIGVCVQLDRYLGGGQ